MELMFAIFCVFLTPRLVDGFSAREIRDIVYVHNEVRRRVEATDMSYLSWDARLAGRAQYWADRCREGYDGNRTSAQDEFVRVGQNIQILSDHPGMCFHIEHSWFGQGEFYNYQTGYCAIESCRHYIQIVWAESRFVGCGLKLCPKIGSHKNKYFAVCNYGTGAYLKSVQPYREGSEPCSQCYPKLMFCIEGLCHFEPDVSSSTRSSLTTLFGTLLVIGYLAT